MTVQMGKPPTGLPSDEAAQEACYSAAIISAQPELHKREATLTAECALAGVTLIPSHDERGRRVYVVSRWALTKELPDLDAVETWLQRVKGASV